MLNSSVLELFIIKINWNHPLSQYSDSMYLDDTSSKTLMIVIQELGTKMVHMNKTAQCPLLFKYTAILIIQQSSS